MTELGLRVWTYCGEFFYGEHWAWNFFDAFLVFLQVPSQLEHMVRDLQIHANISFKRRIRLLRLIRIVRLVWVVHLFEELQSSLCRPSNAAVRWLGQ